MKRLFSPSRNLCYQLLLALCLIIASSTNVFANTCVAQAGGGDWTSAGTWGSCGGIAPTAADDALLDGTSGNVTIDSGAVCRSLDLTGYTGTLTHTAGVTLNIGDATAGASNNALIFPAAGGWTYTLGNSNTSAIAFISTSSTAQNVNFNSKPTGDVTYNGVGGSWILTGAHSNPSKFPDVTLTNGTLNTNGHNITCGTFNSSNSNTRTLTLGASTINVYTWTMATTTNLTFNANTSTINPSGVGTGTIFAGGGLTYNIVVIENTTNSNFTISGANTFGTLTITGMAGKFQRCQLSSSQTVTGTLTMNGNSAINRLYVSSSDIPGAKTLTAATVVASNLDLEEITGAGAGSWDLSAITGLSGDCGGNSGITFTTAAAQTWNGTSGGNWSANAWTSRVPLPQDNVSIASAFGASQTITVDTHRMGKNVDFTGTTGTPTVNINSSAVIYGVTTFISGITPSGTGSLTIRNRTDNNFTTGGITATWSYTLSGISGGSITLVGNLISTAISTGSVSISGEFDANDYNLTANDFAFSSTPVTTASLGNGTWTATISSGNAWNSLSAGTTITAEGSLIVIENTGASNKTFGGGSHTFNDFLISNSGSGSITVSGNNTFADFADDGSEAHSILFTTGTTQTVDTFTVSGTAGKLITINSTTTGTHALVKSTAGRINRDYLNIQHSVVTPDCTWFSGTNSVNNQGDATAGSGWYFTAAPSASDSMKTKNGLAGASIDTCNGFDRRCIKTLNGLSVTV